MSIFRRGRGNQPPAADQTEQHPEADAADATVAATGATDAAAESAGVDASGAATARAAGPYDRSEVDGPQGRLDLGSLWVAGIPGMELRLEVEDETQTVVGATAVLGESAVQLQAFAAPRSEGIWDEIRGEIAASITRQGGTAEHVPGPLGAELQARMPGQGPDGRTMFSPARFLGVDGPRWFLRAVLSGRAAIDPEAALPLVELIRATVVVRGEEAMAPRDLLPLRLPVEPEDSGVIEAEHPSSADPGAELNPFERGPEITEIR